MIGTKYSQEEDTIPPHLPREVGRDGTGSLRKRLRLGAGESGIGLSR